MVVLKVYCYKPTLNFNTKSYLILISSDILELKKGLKKMFTQETNCPSDKKRRLGRGCAKGTFDFFSWSYLQVSSFYLPTKVNFFGLQGLGHNVTYIVGKMLSISSSSIIHPRYYKHLKKGAHQIHLGRQKWAGCGRLACTSSKTGILNKIGI